jgi:hypothetical protein
LEGLHTAPLPEGDSGGLYPVDNTKQALPRGWVYFFKVLCNQYYVDMQTKHLLGLWLVIFYF